MAWIGYNNKAEIAHNLSAILKLIISKMPEVVLVQYHSQNSSCYSVHILLHAGVDFTQLKALKWLLPRSK